MGIPELSPEACKWIIGGLLLAIGFLSYTLKITRAAWKSDIVYYRTQIRRLENTLDDKDEAHAEDR